MQKSARQHIDVSAIACVCVCIMRERVLWLAVMACYSGISHLNPVLAGTICCRGMHRMRGMRSKASAGGMDIDFADMVYNDALDIVDPDVPMLEGDPTEKVFRHACLLARKSSRHVWGFRLTIQP
jgi:hypothetical protein